MELSIASENSGIKTVPLSALQMIFEKAKCLLQKQGLLVPKLGATNGSYTLAGSTNNAYTMTPTKGNSLKCDKACINAKSTICKNVLAAAEHI